MARIMLPPPRTQGSIGLEAAMAGRRSLRAFGPHSISLADFGQLLWAAQGVTQADGRRAAPSAGALYPLEIIAAVGTVDELPPGLYRYHADSHGIELLADGDHRAALAAAALNQAWMADAAVLFAVTAVAGRTAARYGERAGRYVLLEAGHAAQNLCLQAVALGMGVTVVAAFDDGAVIRLLRLGPDELPLCLLSAGCP